jgi:hypothetical protein
LDEEGTNSYVTCKECESGYTIFDNTAESRSECRINNCTTSTALDANDIPENELCDSDSCGNNFRLSPDQKTCYEENTMGRDSNCEEITDDGECILCVDTPGTIAYFQ